MLGLQSRLHRLTVINEMDLGRCTRCIFITWGLLIIVCQTTRSNTHYGSVGASASEKFDLMVSEQFLPRSYSHRVLLLTVLCTLCLALLSCAGKLQLRSLCPLSFFLSFLGYFLCCCCCCGLWTRRTANLDAYAPRTQSIVWPQVPEETARVVELTFLHEPGSVDCLCRNCELARDQRCIPHCSASAEC